MASSASAWSEVPSDILCLVTQCLPIAADYIRFGAVCSSWRAALAENRRQQVPQVPWLIISDTVNKTSSSSRIKFLSLSENNKEYCMDLPPEFYCGHVWMGSSNGWLISVDEAWDVHMFDPISRSHARLRSAITDFPDITPEELSLHGMELMCQLYFTKIIVQSPSSSKRKLVVAAINSISDKLIIATQRDVDESCSWATVPTEYHYHRFQDIIFYQNQLFAIDWFGWVHACDLSDPSRPKVSFSIHPPRNWKYIIYDNNFLVESLSGELLHVSHRRRSRLASTPPIRVFKTDPNGRRKKKWVELKSLGDHAIFLDYMNQSLILSTQDFPELERDGVYITPDFRKNWTCPAYNYYNMEDGTITQHEPYVDHLPLWFAPIFKF